MVELVELLLQLLRTHPVDHQVQVASVKKVHHRAVVLVVLKLLAIHLVDLPVQVVSARKVRRRVVVE